MAKFIRILSVPIARILSSATDGGCRSAQPAIPSNECSCNYNPTVSVYAGCDANNNPAYFDSSDDIPNGACVASFKDPMVTAI